MTNEGAKDAAGQDSGFVWRFSATIVGRDPAALGRIQNAITGKLDGSILDSQMHIVKDDAHPAAGKK